MKMLLVDVGMTRVKMKNRFYKGGTNACFWSNVRRRPKRHGFIVEPTHCVQNNYHFGHTKVSIYRRLLASWALFYLIIT